MPSDPNCILSVRAEASDSGKAEFSQKLARASEAGFGSLLWRHDWSLFGSDSPRPELLVDAAGEAGLRVIIEIDVTRFPLDHPLVRQHPDLFAIRRRSDPDRPVDPRKAMPPSGEAIARLQHREAAAVFGKAIGLRLKELASAGIGGFRLLNPQRLDAEMVAAIANQLLPLDVVLVAGALKGGVAGSGVDYRVDDFGFRDLVTDGVFAGDSSGGSSLPQLAELRSQQPVSDEDDTGLERLLTVAAASASGMIVSDSLLAQSADPFALAARAIAVARDAAAYDGGIRRLSGGSRTVTSLLRTRAGDASASRGALLVLINLTGEVQPAPARGPIIQRAGTPLDLAGADFSSLAAGEVRLIALEPAKPVEVRPEAGATAAARYAEEPRFVVQSIEPRVEGGDFAVKRVVGDRVEVSATIFADGHEHLAAELRWRPADEAQWTAVRLAQGVNDLWTASFTLERMGGHEFVVEAWLDRFGGFRRDFTKKRDATVDQPVDHDEGRVLVEQALSRSSGRSKTELSAWLASYRKAKTADMTAELLLGDRLAMMMDGLDDRPHRLTSPVQRVDAERISARFSSWYELFPRSMTDDKLRHGTFADVIPHLGRVRDMGFDTLYFPPIHPIGKTNRKGPNNTLTPEDHDVGSPYAIGGPDGGHDAIHPELGGFEDFDLLVSAAREHGLEIALDFAIQASPDHPWLKQHPGWFAWRSDGSMKYAENPPKKYQDIVNLDFYGPDAVPDLWLALRDVVELWIGHGVSTFRVDNPHTKPLPFWEWMIRDIRDRHPEAIFLAEAFTKPAMMHRLAKVGFSQSYTYFTWRDGKQELTDYITELTDTEPREFYRPHFFVNTPDINPLFLQNSGRPGFRIRAVLAATLSGLFGVYSGFELCEAAGLPGREEYLDSEKYEIRPRDYAAPGNIIADITLLNRLRRAHPALQTHLNTRFYLAQNDNIIWYGKPSPDGDEMIMVMVNLDPHHAQECHFEVPLWKFGLSDTSTIAVEDLAQGHRFDWHGKTQWIRIAPDLPYRIWRLSAPGGLA